MTYSEIDAKPSLERLKNLTKVLGLDIDLQSFKECNDLNILIDENKFDSYDQEIINRKSREVIEIFRVLSMSYPKILIKRASSRNKSLLIEEVSPNQLLSKLNLKGVKDLDLPNTPIVLISPPYFKLNQTPLLITFNQEKLIEKLKENSPEKLQKYLILNVVLHTDMEQYDLTSLKESFSNIKDKLKIESKINNLETLSIPPSSIVDLLNKLDSWITNIELGPDKTVKEWLAGGELYSRSGDVENAILHYDKAIEPRPQQFKCLLSLGSLNRKERSRKGSRIV